MDSDHVCVDCRTCREALSARIDGETEPVPATLVDEHLEECAECRAWLTRAVDLSRSLRVREAAPVPDQTAAIMEKAPVFVDTRGWSPRLMLGGVGVAQIGLAITQLVGVGTTAAQAQHSDVLVTGHLFNEGTAWNLALGVGMFWAAFRPRATSGLIPLIGAFLVVLLGYSTHDLIIGAVPVTRVAWHALPVAGLALLIIINRQYGRPAPHDGAAVDSGAEPETANTGAKEVAAPGKAPEGPRQPPLRPAGRHDVA